MQPLITDRRVQAVAGARHRWRWTDLHAALVAEFGCSSSTGRRAIQRGMDEGYLAKSGRWYQLAPIRPSRDPAAGPEEPIRRLIPDRLALLEVIGEREDWQSADLLSELRRRFRMRDSAARRNFDYAHTFGYVERVNERWRLTGGCRRLMSRYGRLDDESGYRFATFLSGKPMKRFDRWERSRDLGV
jgi:hypothetical protein